MKSTLIQNGPTELIDTFEVSMICELYQKSIGVNVERLFEDIDKIELFKCLTTGYRFFYPSSIIGDALFYRQIASLRSNYYSERWEHLKSLNYIKNNDKILEIGSGYGSYIKTLKKNSILNIKGIELSSLAIEKCLEDELDVELKLIENLPLNEKFDIICSFQVLEHVYDVNSFITSSIQRLNSNGKLVLGVPNNNPYLFKSDKYHTLNLPPHHAGLWSKRSLKLMARAFNLKVIATHVEPLSKSYLSFLNYHSSNGNIVKQKLLRLSNKFLPNLLRILITQFFEGRNILIVLQKK